MLDFSSSLYLGLHHPSRSLAPWDRLTTGVPAALREPPEARRVAGALARLQGCERAVLARSTLHAFVDCFAALGGPARPVLVDAGAYPIAGWGAAAMGRPVTRFAHHDVADLRLRLRRGGRGPLVVTDGFCPGCGAVAPLAAYLEVVADHQGILLIDDTQALGVLGRRDGPRAGPYGAGGGGSLPWTGVAGPGVLAVASLAKGFGVPLAVVAGGRRLVGRVAAGPARVHASPPSAADLRAAERALAGNRRIGEGRRRRLAALVARLRHRLVGRGIVLRGGAFPIQSLPTMAPSTAAAVAEALAARGVRGVLQRSRCQGGATVTLVVTALHTTGAIDRAAAAVADALAAAGVLPRQAAAPPAALPSDGLGR
jgi:8-amino-7-oxononanoate synthase